MIPQIVIFKQVRVPPNLFKDLKGGTKQKKSWKTLFYVIDVDAYFLVLDFLNDIIVMNVKFWSSEYKKS